MINFDSLPNENSFAAPVFEKGRYTAKVSKADMVQGKDPSKPPYLNLQWTLSKNGKVVGPLFDMITESDSDIPRYKLKRFIIGLGLPIRGNFELKDLAKVVIGKECELDVTIDTRGETEKSVVDVFSGEIYYPLAAANMYNSPSEVAALDAQDVAPVSDTDTASNESNY